MYKPLSFTIFNSFVGTEIFAIPHATITTGWLLTLCTIVLIVALMICTVPITMEVLDYAGYIQQQQPMESKPTTPVTTHNKINYGTIMDTLISNSDSDQTDDIEHTVSHRMDTDTQQIDINTDDTPNTDNKHDIYLSSHSYDFPTLSRMVSGRIQYIALTCTTILYTSTMLWATTSTFAAQLAANIHYYWYSTDDSVVQCNVYSQYVEAHCWTTYNMSVGILLVLMCILGILNQKLPTVFTDISTIYRIVALLVMLGSMLYVESNVDNVTESLDSTVSAQWIQLQSTITLIATAYNIHYSMYEIIQTLNHKQQARFIRTCISVMCIVTVLYILIGVMAAATFNNNIYGVITLNWLTYNGTNFTGIQQHKNTWIVSCIRSIVLWFPIVDAIPSYNSTAWTQADTLHDIVHSISHRVCYIITVIVTISISWFAVKIDTIFMLAGLLAILLSINIPIHLYNESIKYIHNQYNSSITSYYHNKYVTANVTQYMLLTLSACINITVLGLIVYSFF